MIQKDKETTGKKPVVAPALPDAKDSSAIVMLLQVPIIDSEGHNIGSKEYFIDNNKPLGKGAFGTVYKAYLLGKDDYPDYSKPFAVKVCKKDEFAETEAEIFSSYYRSEKPIYLGNKVYFIMQLLPGDDLFLDDECINPIFQNLDFGTTLELIQQLCIAINPLHHDTLSTGDAIVHGDIKGSNIKVHIGEKNRIVVNPVDFGLSSKLLNDDPNTIASTQNIRGTLIYMAPEAYHKQQLGTKSDIFSLVPIILSLLGADQPFKFRDQAINAGHHGQAVTEKFNFANLLVKFAAQVNQIGYPVKLLIERFLNKMQLQFYEGRPGTDLVAKFFGSLNICYKISQEKIAQEKKLKECTNYRASIEIKKYILGLNHTLQRLYSTMILLAYGFWKPTLDAHLDISHFQSKIIEHYNKLELNSNNIAVLLIYINEFNKQMTAGNKSLSLLTKKGFSTLAIRTLEEQLESEPLRVNYLISQRLERFEKRQIDQFNFIVRLYHDYGVVLKIDDLEELLNPSNMNLLSVAKNCIQAHIIKNTLEGPPSPGGVFSFSFLKYNFEEEFAAVKKLATKFENPSVALTKREESVLLASSLGNMIRELGILEKLAAQFQLTIPPSLP